MAAQLQFKKDDVIFKQGDFETKMYFIKAGKVDIITDYGKESAKTITTLGEEKIFGEMGLVDYMPRTASAIATEDVTVDVYDQDDFAEILKTNPSIMYMLLKSISDRTASLSKDYQDCCTEISNYYKTEKEGKGTLTEKLLSLIKLGKSRA